MRAVVIIILFFIFITDVNSQNNNKLASQYFREQEYQKASELFSDLYNQTNSSYYFTYYIKCLIELKDFKQAEKIIKKKIRQNKTDLSYYVELGFLYKIQGEISKANKQFETGIKNIQKNRNSVFSISNAFISKRLYNWAEKSYLKGRKLLKKEYTFNYELANVYLYQRNYPKMIDEYLDLIEQSPAYLKSVQNRLQRLVYSSKEDGLNDIFRESLLKKIQKNPNNDIFSELLIWFFIQQKDFENAFIQTKAIDKRNKEEGERMLKLAQLAMSNKNYAVAVNCYDYIINEYKRSIYYLVAKPKLAEVLYLKIIDHTPIKQEIIKLKALFVETISELGENKSTFPIIVNLARVEAYNLNNYDTAIYLLNKALKIKNVKRTNIDDAKLVLGDIFLLKGESWNSALIYAQVEQDNKDNPIGNKARFKKAKLAYFTGDFLWAQAQLDVLKASTSKLIANNAFELSSLISDNIETDSTGEQLTLYARADLLMYSKKDSIAKQTLDSIAILFPASSLIDNAIYKKAEINYRNGEYKKSIGNLKEITEKYSYDILYDDALYFWAEIELYKFKNKDKAMQLYKKILTEVKASYYTTSARAKFRELRGDSVE